MSRPASVLPAPFATAAPQLRTEESKLKIRPVNRALELSYKQILAAFCKAGDHTVLDRAHVLSEGFAAAAVTSGEIVALHTAAVQELGVLGDASTAVASQRFLLEVMISYGVIYSGMAERLLVEAGAMTALEHIRAEAADLAEHERLELLAGVSHELGTPITVIKGNFAAIRRSLEQDDRWPEELDSAAADIEFAVERMLALRGDLLAASRDEQLDLELVPVHLPHCLRRVVRWAQITATEKQIHVTNETSPQIPVVIGDEGAIQSIFNNLLSNAIRYTPAGGAVGVKTSCEGPRVSVEVTDSGIGISSQDQQRIFERFYRAPEARNMVSFGLGLGLAITRELVSALGGTIELTSAAGAGSTFKVTLPAASAPDEGSV